MNNPARMGAEARPPRALLLESDQRARSLLSGGRSGRLSLADHGGALTFAQGRIIQATFGSREGEDALTRLLLLGHGSYEVSFGPALARSEFSWDLRRFCQVTLPKVRA